MIFEEQRIYAKDGVSYVFKTPEESDGEKCADFIYKVCQQTPYLLRCGEDSKPTVSEETTWVKKHRESNDSYLIAAYTNTGEQIASADIKFGNHIKNKHTASVGIVIDKHYHGIGIGTILFDLLFSLARQHNIEIMTLEMVDENMKARGLYRKFGFKQVGLLENGFKYDGQYYDLAIMRAVLVPINK